MLDENWRMSLKLYTLNISTTKSFLNLSWEDSRYSPAFTRWSKHYKETWPKVYSIVFTNRSYNRLDYQTCTPPRSVSSLHSCSVASPQSQLLSSTASFRLFRSGFSILFQSSHANYLTNLGKSEKCGWNWSLNPKLVHKSAKSFEVVRIMISLTINQQFHCLDCVKNVPELPKAKSLYGHHPF